MRWGAVAQAILAVLIGVPGFLRPATPPPAASLNLAKDAYYDKTLAGILGQVGGFLSGYEFVSEDPLPDEWFRLTYGPYSGDSPYWAVTDFPGYDRLFADGRVGSDDDYHVDFFNQHILDAHGPDVSYQDIMAEWVAHQVRDFGAGGAAMELMNAGVPPPLTGSGEHNRFSWVTEAYIETETVGMVAPGMPVTAGALTEKFAGLLSDADPAIWANFLATMYAMAYFEDDVRTVVERAAVVLPANSWPYQIYRHVLALHERNPTDWRWAATELQQVRRFVYGYDNPLVLPDMNNGMLLISLLYGGNDYLTTARIASLSGFDADCTAAAALGLMGIIKGMDGTPAEIKTRVYADGRGVYVNDPEDPFPPVITQDYPTEQRWTDLAALYQRNAEDQILANGGRVDGDAYAIAGQRVGPPVVVPVANPDFERGDLSGWTSSAPGHAEAKKFRSAQSGEWHATISSDETVAEVDLTTDLRDLEPGATYRVSAFVRSDREARLFVAGEGVPERYASVMATVGTNGREWVKRSVEFAAGAETATVGLRLPPGPTGRAEIDNLAVERITAPDATRHEAEDAARAGGEVRAASGASGGGYVGGLDDVGDQVRFTVRAERAGDYRLAIRYANGWAGLEFGRLNLSVNGVAAATVPFPRTGTEGVFSANVVAVPVELRAGENTVTLQKDVVSAYTGHVELDAVDLGPFPATVAAGA